MEPKIIRSDDAAFGEVIDQLSASFDRAFGRPQEERAARPNIIWGEVQRDEHWIVDVAGDKVRGAVSWRVWGEQRHHFAELVHILTDPAYLHLGIGRGLVSIMEEDIHAHFRRLGLPGARMIFIFTHETNTGAQRFYESCGYARGGLLEGFYYDDVNEVVYMKRFPRPSA